VVPGWDTTTLERKLPETVALIEERDAMAAVRAARLGAHVCRGVHAHAETSVGSAGAGRRHDAAMRHRPPTGSSSHVAAAEQQAPSQRLRPRQAAGGAADGDRAPERRLQER
jgi:hypothetical protein